MVTWSHGACTAGSEQHQQRYSHACVRIHALNDDKKQQAILIVWSRLVEKTAQGDRIGTQSHSLFRRPLVVLKIVHRALVVVHRALYQHIYQYQERTLKHVCVDGYE